MKSETREYNDKLQAHRHSSSSSEVYKSVSGDEAYILILEAVITPPLHRVKNWNKKEKKEPTSADLFCLEE